MMAGVGLSLAEWMLDATGGYVIAVATPAI